MSLVPYSSSESKPEMPSSPETLTALVSTQVDDSNALICPKVALQKNSHSDVCKKKDSYKKKDNNKNKGSNTVGSEKERCPPSVCKMKRPNCRTWWVQCDLCEQWFHMKCVNIKKKQAKLVDFKCNNCV